jgi:hypothetical protein
MPLTVALDEKLRVIVAPVREDVPHCRLPFDAELMIGRTVRVAVD